MNTKKFASVKAPPVGLMPRKIHSDNRTADVCDAISRYARAGKNVPAEWIDELKELLERQLPF